MKHKTQKNDLNLKL